MTRPKKSWLIVFAAILLLCVGLKLYWRPDRHPPHELSAVFRGWGVNTVWPNKPAVLLEVTNPTPVAVSLSVYAVERESLSGWRLDEPAFVGACLEPGAAFVLQVPVAISNATWRIRLHCQERAAGLGGLADRANDKFEAITSKTIRTRYNGRIYYVTNEIRQPQ
jgi:hypothetical protein